MPDYLLHLRFPALDDDHALRRAHCIAGSTVAEWDHLPVLWESVTRGDGSRVQPQPGEVDPVLVSAAWGGQAGVIESDEDMAAVVARIVAALQSRYIPPPPGSDRDALPGPIRAAIAPHMPPYLSTYCQTADACTAAAGQQSKMAGELREWAARQHTSCRLTRKQDMAPCQCPCHSKET